METPNFQNLDEAKAYINSLKHEGVKCPCCYQLVKYYPYKLSSGMAYVLIQMYKSDKEWVHPIQEFRTVNGDYAKLRWWGLIEDRQDEPEEDKKASGYWRITPKGMAFVEGTIKVTEKAILFDNQCWGYEGDEIYITDALSNKFNYSELMGNFVRKRYASINGQIDMVF